MDSLSSSSLNARLVTYHARSPRALPPKISFPKNAFSVPPRGEFVLTNKNLESAILNGDEESVSLILRLNAMMVSVGFNILHRSPLITALRCQPFSPSMIRLIVSHGFDVNDAGSDTMPIMEVIEKGDLALAALLADLGANVNQICPRRGITPLEYAFEFEDAEMSRLLLLHRATVGYRVVRFLLASPFSFDPYTPTVQSLIDGVTVNRYLSRVMNKERVDVDEEALLAIKEGSAYKLALLCHLFPRFSPDRCLAYALSTRQTWALLMLLNRPGADPIKLSSVLKRLMRAPSEGGQMNKFLMRHTFPLMNVMEHHESLRRALVSERVHVVKLLLRQPIWINLAEMVAFLGAKASHVLNNREMMSSLESKRVSVCCFDQFDRALTSALSFNHPALLGLVLRQPYLADLDKVIQFILERAPQIQKESAMMTLLRQYFHPLIDVPVSTSTTRLALAFMQEEQAKYQLLLDLGADVMKNQSVLLETIFKVVQGLSTGIICRKFGITILKTISLFFMQNCHRCLRELGLTTDQLNLVAEGVKNALALTEGLSEQQQFKMLMRVRAGGALVISFGTSGHVVTMVATSRGMIVANGGEGMRKHVIMGYEFRGDFLSLIAFLENVRGDFESMDACNQMIDKTLGTPSFFHDLPPQDAPNCSWASPERALLALVSLVGEKISPEKMTLLFYLFDTFAQSLVTKEYLSYTQFDQRVIAEAITKIRRRIDGPKQLNPYLL